MSLRHHDQMCISTVTLMELIYGVEKFSNLSCNLADMEGSTACPEVLKYDQEAVARIGQLRAELAHLGKQTSPYDQMVTGHTRSQSLIVVTNNRRESGRIFGSRVENWVVLIVQPREIRSTMDENWEQVPPIVVERELAQLE